MSEKVWHYSVGGDRRGPVAAEELRQLAATGDISPDDLVWKQGMAGWVAASTIKGLFAKPPKKGPPPLPLKDVPAAPAAALSVDDEADDKPAKAKAGPLQPILAAWQKLPTPAKLGVGGGGLLLAFLFCGGLVFLRARFATDEDKVKVEIKAPRISFSGVNYSQGPDGEALETREEINGVHKVEAQGFRGGGKFVYHGTMVEWYRDGKQKYSETKWVNGMKHGLQVCWFPDGRKKFEEGYADGKLEGYSASWYADGTKRHEAVFSKGRHVGPAVDYHESGRKRRVRNYADGRHEDMTILWREDGSRLRELVYAERKLQIDRWFTPDGAKVADPPIKTMSVAECLELLRDLVSSDGVTRGSFSWPGRPFTEPDSQRRGEWEYRCQDGKLVFRSDENEGRGSTPRFVTGLSLYRDKNDRAKKLTRAEFKKRMLALRDEWGSHPITVVVPWSEAVGIFGEPNGHLHIESDRRMLIYDCVDGSLSLDAKLVFRHGSNGDMEVALVIIERMD